MRNQHLLRKGTPVERFEALRAVVTPERTRMLQALPYDSFLRTGYWRIITAYLRETRGYCESCGGTRRLQAHHKTYTHHGREHDHLDDLQLLCRWCHATEHGITVKRDGWTPISQILPAVLAAARSA